MQRIFLFVATNIAVLVVLSIFLNVVGFDQWAVRQGVDFNTQAMLIFSAVFGMGGAFISLLLSKKMAQWSTGARLIKQPANEMETWLLSTVERQARMAEIGMPDVAIFPAQAPNAFATGASRNNALVAVSEGLLREMRREEVEAVIGHEISHVANGDMVTMTLLQGVLNTFVIFLSRAVGFFVDRLIFRNERGVGIGYFMVVILAQIVLGIFASMIVAAFSRYREFRADAGGAHLAGAGKMIAALERLKASHEPAHMPDQLAAFGIRPAEGFSRLFMSHPPLDERIARLKQI